MATDKYPHRNVNMPMDQAALAGTRAASSSGRPFAPAQSLPSSNQGSRRQTKPGEWVDDRKIDIGGPAIPSKDSPPVWEEQEHDKEGRAGVYNEDYYFNVELAKSCTVDGRVLSPGKAYVMIGSTVNAISDSVLKAVSITDMPPQEDPQQ